MKVILLILKTPKPMTLKLSRKVRLNETHRTHHIAYLGSLTKMNILIWFNVK